MWARRNTAVATAITVAVLAVLLGAGTFAAQRLAAEREREAAIVETFDTANGLVADYLSHWDDVERREAELRELEYTRMQYLTRGEDELFDRRELELEQLSQEREETFYSVLDLLGQAERLGASEESIRAVRARLYLARFKEATVRHDAFEQKLYRDLVRRDDLAG